LKLSLSDYKYYRYIKFYIDLLAEIGSLNILKYVDSHIMELCSYAARQSLVFGFMLKLYGYGSIPIDTIFSGMNIHKSQLFTSNDLGFTRYQGFDPSPYGNPIEMS